MRRTTLMLALLVTLVVPGASFAQSAGDEQYVDPFQNDRPQGDQGGSGGGGGGGGGESQETQDEGSGTAGGGGESAPAEPAPAPLPEGGDGTAGAAPSGTDTATLPNTGLAPVPLLLLGATLAVAGVALRRRA
jgi:hypothetical protein